MKHMIVVGAGILGASLAYHLVNRGIKASYRPTRFLSDQKCR